MAVGIRNIASELEISPSTVSRALRGDGNVHPDTKSQILRVADSLGYTFRPHRNRKVSSSRVKGKLLLAFIQTESYELEKENSNTMRLLSGIIHGAESYGRTMNVSLISPRQKGHFEMDDHLKHLIAEGYVGGAIFISQHSSEDVKSITDMIPGISINWDFSSSYVDRVVSDGIYGVSCIVDHLVALGHSRIAWAGSFEDNILVEDRHMGYIKGMLRNKLPINSDWMAVSSDYECSADNNDNSVLKESIIKRFLKNKISAIVCANDMVAVNLAEKLTEMGIRIPQDMNITGYDNFDISTAATSSLTTIDPAFEEMGRLAVYFLNRRRDNPAVMPGAVMVKGKLVEGESTCKV